MPFPLPHSDSGSATSACPERNQRRTLSVSSVVKSDSVSSLPSELCALSVLSDLAEGIFSDSSYPCPNPQKAPGSIRTIPLSPTIPAHTRPPGEGVYTGPLVRPRILDESGTQHEPPSHLRVAPPGI